MCTHMHAFPHTCLPTCMHSHMHAFLNHLFLHYAFSHACVFTRMCFHMHAFSHACIFTCIFLCNIASMKFKVAFLHECICRCTCITIDIVWTIEKAQHVTHQHSFSPHNCCHDAHLPRYCSLILAVMFALILQYFFVGHGHLLIHPKKSYSDGFCLT